MKITQMFVVILTIGLVSSLFLLMLNEEKMYVGKDFNEKDLALLNETQKLEETQQNLYNTFYSVTGSEGGLLSNVGKGIIVASTGLVQIGVVIKEGLFLLPKLLSEILQIVLPPKVANVVVASVMSVLSIILIIKLVFFIIGRE